jgi:hypothetical protein
MDPGRPECVSYPVAFSPDAVASAESLAHRGLVSRRFFERFHACGACQSRRLNAREECPACGSAHLTESALLHHFHCAHLAPEEAFRNGHHLSCPKCRGFLRHYGSDYDKPGTVLRCEACGVHGSEPNIGFACLDCGRHTDADAARKVDVYAYRLTEAGIAFATRLPDDLATRRVEDPLPDGVSAEVTRRMAAGEAPLVMELHHNARERIVAEKGEPTFARLRRLFAENLAGTLGATGSVVSANGSDFVVSAAPPDELPPLLEKAGALLVERLEPRIARYGQGTADPSASRPRNAAPRHVLRGAAS